VPPDIKPGAFAYRRGIRAGGLDYFLISERLRELLVDVSVHPRIRGSDHYPLELVLRI
jgi:exonuclease III